MHSRAVIRDFLTSRRARITPHEVGLPGDGPRRRVPGLRREEVAVLAGVSTEWYTRLEKGHIAEVSDSVLTAVSRALRLDEVEQGYLKTLAQSSRGTLDEAPPAAAMTPSLHRVLAAISGAPAIVYNGRLDLVAANPLGRELYRFLYQSQGPVPNIARFNLLDPAAAQVYPELAAQQRTTVALLRREFGSNPADPVLQTLLADLGAGSAVFRRMWKQHDVEIHRAGSKLYLLPDVGPVQLDYDSMELAGAPGLTMSVFTAASEVDAEMLTLMASWRAESPTAPGDELVAV